MNLELLGRRIAAAVMAVGGGLFNYFDEGLGYAIGWIVLVALVYAAIARWVPLTKRA